MEDYKKAIIISGFSCLGKTYLGKKYDNVLDLEASDYKWIYYDKELAKDVEKRKGITNRIVNPDYPENYLSALLENINNYSIILITPEKRIREELMQRCIPYLVAYPTNPEFLVDRAIERRNNLHFAQGLKKSYIQWYPEEKVLWVKENEYLEDTLRKENII